MSRASEERGHAFRIRLSDADEAWFSTEAAGRVLTKQAFVFGLVHAIRVGDPTFLREVVPRRRIRGAPSVADDTQSALPSVRVRFGGEEARWLLVESAKRRTTPPRLLTRILEGIRLGGSPLIDELLRGEPSPSLLGPSRELVGVALSLPKSALAWFAVQAARRRLSRPALLREVILGVRARDSRLLTELADAGDLRGKAGTLSPPEKAHQIVTSLTAEEALWLDVTVSEHLMTAQAFLLVLIHSLRAGGTPFLADLLSAPANTSRRARRGPAVAGDG